MVEKDNSKISILIVSRTEKVRRLAIPQWLPKLSLSLLAVILLASFTYLGSISYNHRKLKSESRELNNLLASLEEDNKYKSRELKQLKSENEFLQSMTEEVEDKLLEINALQREVEKLTGAKTPSRGGSSRNMDIDSMTPSQGMGMANQLLDDTKVEMEDYLVDVQARLDYLETIPDLMPSHGRLTSRFGSRRDPFSGRTRQHKGIDIANSPGTNIKAAGKGQVILAGSKGGYGRTIIIDHGNGYKSLYGHNSKLLVDKGQWVEKGQVISKMGSTGRSTGPHLHFEIHKNNIPINPYDLLKN